LAAHRGGITTVLIPADNAKDLAEIPENIKQNLDIKPVHWIDEVLAVALQSLPTPTVKNEADDKAKAELDSVKIKNQGLTAH